MSRARMRWLAFALIGVGAIALLTMLMVEGEFGDIPTLILVAGLVLLALSRRSRI